MSAARSGNQAIVIGAGIGGLSAAQVLADHFEQVVVLERDRLPAVATYRAGVPQGRHLHLLLGGGLQALAELFPGIEHDFAQAGAVPLDAGSDLRYEYPGQAPFPRHHLGLLTYAMSRPLLELTLRRRVEQRSNVILRDRCRATEILGTSDGSRVTGVRYQTVGMKSGTLPADIVVDASGRGILTLAFLEATGRSWPKETVIGVDVGYATATLSIPSQARPDFKGLVTLPNAPENSRYGCLLPVEGDRFLALVVGRGADCPPADSEEFLAYAKHLETPTFYNAIKGAKRLGGIARFSFSESVWRHFAAMAGFPSGLLPIADTICRFNPAYGQGMSVAAKEACVLGRLLRTQALKGDSLTTLGQAFLAEAEALIATPWALAAVADFVYPQTRGQRPDNVDRDIGFQVALNRIALRDSTVRKVLAEVQNLLKPLNVLNDPAIVARVTAEMEMARVAA